MSMAIVLIAVLLVFVISVSVFLLLLPALIELRNPQDRGPRIIEENLPTFLFRQSQVRIVNIDVDEKQKLTVSLERSMAKVIAFLPNLEV
jgi:hypothetical protein